MRPSRATSTEAPATCSSAITRLTMASRSGAAFADCKALAAAAQRSDRPSVRMDDVRMAKDYSCHCLLSIDLKSVIPMTNSFDALLIVSFGGPEKHEDVLPFLEN